MSMNELETEAIVVASREYRERDLLVTLLTPQGKQGVNARGTLKIDSRNAAALQLCTKGIYRLSRSGSPKGHLRAVLAGGDHGKLSKAEALAAGHGHGAGAL